MRYPLGIFGADEWPIRYHLSSRPRPALAALTPPSPTRRCCAEAQFYVVVNMLDIIARVISASLQRGVPRHAERQADLNL